MEYVHGAAGIFSPEQMEREKLAAEQRRNEAWESLKARAEDIRIIDFHTHIFPDRIAKGALHALAEESQTIPFTAATAESLRESMREAGVDLSIVLPVVTHADKTGKINLSAAKTNETDTGILSFAGIHPGVEDPKKELKFAKALGLKGVKLHPDYYRMSFDSPETMRIIDLAAEMDMIILTHAGKDIGLYPPTCCPVDAIKRVIREIHPPKLVLAHMGGWNDWDEVLEKLAGEDVYFDTAFSIGDIHWMDQPKHGFHQLSDEAFVKLVYAVGTDRVLFATDCPWAEQIDYVNRIKAMPFTPEEKQAIFAGNAKRLLGL
ncbi:MAG: amidohydrolase [Eubacterium sp.]|nr:amidohydrolase [Eubacterium sp.]